MPFKYPNSQRKPYTQVGINGSTTSIGVYGIFDSQNSCIYIGMTENRSEGIRGRVMDHYDGNTGNSYCINQTHTPSYFMWEDEGDITRDKKTISEREEELIREYKAKGEAYCNDRVG